MPSRLGDLETLLRQALDRGYETHSIAGFWELINRKEISDEKRYLILRHDIDTDVSTARRIWRLEQDLGIQGSYYFRLSTIDVSFMREIEKSGSEAGYHFEELATVSKIHGLTNKDAVLASLPEAREMFRKNLNKVREATGLPVRTVASHGDFANRKSGIANTVLLEDEGLRKELDIELEVYDEKFMSFVDHRYADSHFPQYWTPSPPALDGRPSITYLLLHPRNWHSNRLENAKDDCLRAREGLLYGLGYKNKRVAVTGKGLREPGGHQEKLASR